MRALSMSVRNVFRYRRRSFITAAAIAFGVMATIAVDGLLAGTERESERNIRNFETGEIKVFPVGYFEDRDLLPFDRFIESGERVSVEDVLGRLRWAPRVHLPAELYFNEDYFGVQGSVRATITAVDPVKDAAVLDVAKSVERGRWILPGDSGIVIGSWLADDIGASPGYIIGVECRGRGGFHQTFDAEIVGIATTDNPVVNRNGVFMDLATADELLALDGAVTEYVVRARPGTEAASAIKAIEQRLPSVDPRSWEEVAYDAILLTRAKSSGSKLFIVFIFIIAAVGISNTMLMTVMERRNEIGMLRALGYGKFRIRCQFLLEGFWIGLIGATIGLIAGLLIDLYLIAFGMDFSFMLRDIDMGYRITGVMRSAWNPRGIAVAVLVAVSISTFVAWFPSGRILRQEVADTLRS